MFLLDFEYLMEDHPSGATTAQEAHEYIMQQAGLLHDKSVCNIGSKGTGVNGGPVFEITFATRIKALRYTAAYLGIDYFSQDVIDYVLGGIQV